MVVEAEPRNPVFSVLTKNRRASNGSHDLGSLAGPPLPPREVFTHHRVIRLEASQVAGSVVAEALVEAGDPWVLPGAPIQCADDCEAMHAGGFFLPHAGEQTRDFQILERAVRLLLLGPGVVHAHEIADAPALVPRGEDNFQMGALACRIVRDYFPIKRRGREDLEVEVARHGGDLLDHLAVERGTDALARQPFAQRQPQGGVQFAVVPAPGVFVDEDEQPPVVVNLQEDRADGVVGDVVDG